MGNPKTCNHNRFTRNCRSCAALRRQWYERLRREGFTDIEYGRENARFTAQKVDPGSPTAVQSTAFYDQVWEIYHTWVAHGRRARDCRVAELYATQDGDTGTVRGIARILRSECLAPWSTNKVQETLDEIRRAVKTGVARSHEDTVISITYIRRSHRAA